MLTLSAAEAVVDPEGAAEYVGLFYVSNDKSGIRRLRSGKGFTYKAGGKKVSDAATLGRRTAGVRLC